MSRFRLERLTLIFPEVCAQCRVRLPFPVRNVRLVRLLIPSELVCMLENIHTEEVSRVEFKKVLLYAFSSCMLFEPLIVLVSMILSFEFPPSRIDVEELLTTDEWEILLKSPAIFNAIFVPDSMVALVMRLLFPLNWIPVLAA